MVVRRGDGALAGDRRSDASGRFAPKQSGYGAGFALALPILYGICGFIFTAIGCAIYNLVAGWVGGVEVELDATNH